MGLNVHTVQFKPDLYHPVCMRLRDYHPVIWDLNADLSRRATFPMSANGVEWETMYGSWVRGGFDIDACLIFDDIAAQAWKDPGEIARAYGESFAHFFGPGGKALVSSAEVGNEPSKYTTEQYRAIFQGMARGLRAGDPKLTIATCAVMTGKTDAWSKPLSAIDALEDLYDVLNIHSYPFEDGWPTWRRSFPEDSTIGFLKQIDELIRWRDGHAVGKRIWLTEFGYDSATKPPAADGPWAKWVGVNDELQARYIVRAFLVLSSLEIDRAYLYFFNDNDEAQLHGASGITRHFEPKPSFYAMSHLYRALSDYRFARAIVRKENDLYCFEYERAAHPREHIEVAWLASGDAKTAQRRIPFGAAAKRIYRAERLTTTPRGATKPDWQVDGEDVTLEVGPDPVFVWSR